jgi:hypothetical protein
VRLGRRELATVLIEVDADSGAVRVDEEGFAVLRARADPALAVLDDPLVTLSLEVAGPEVGLRHRGWIDRDTATLLIGVRPDVFQVISLPPAFLTAALVRLTRIRPRRPGGDGPGFGWQLDAVWPGGSRHLVATDGPDGLRLADPGSGALRPASNTEVYRILSTLLPTDAEVGAG